MLQVVNSLKKTSFFKHILRETQIIIHYKKNYLNALLKNLTKNFND